MIYRKLKLGRWVCDFYFCSEDGYDPMRILWQLRSLGAPDSALRRAEKKMEDNRINEGFSWNDHEHMRSVVVVGPSSSGKEFIDTFVHELGHVADGIAKHLGLSLDSEESKYILGDAARDLADVVCRLGCSDCRD